jgi:hypothetical protein
MKEREMNDRVKDETEKVMLGALEKARDSIVSLGTYINVPGLEPAGRALYAEGAAALRAISDATAAACPGCPGRNDPGCEHPMCIAFIRRGERERQAPPVERDLQSTAALMLAALEGLEDLASRWAGPCNKAVRVAREAIAAAKEAGIHQVTEEHRP